MNDRSQDISSVPVPLGSDGVRYQWAALLLMIFSGFAGLGYQIVWTQQCALWLGHESAAVLAIIAAFFGGFSLGAFLLGSNIERSIKPLRWYAACEGAIALWSLALILLMPHFSGAIIELIGTQPTPLWQWSVTFISTFLLLLPATGAMGATLPAIERITGKLQGERRTLAALYSANTFGAVLGVLATAFLLLPEWGLTRTLSLCIGINVFCLFAALILFPKQAETFRCALDNPTLKTHNNLIRLACTGLLGIGYEVLVVRVLSQITENTVYTFALLLAVYLIGTSIGAALFYRWHHLVGNDNRRLDCLLGAQALSCLLGICSLGAAGWLRNLWLSGDASSMSWALGAEALLGLLAFGPATIVMGALFSHLTSAANLSGIDFGRSLSVNTLGAAVAPIVFGVLLTPLLGQKATLLFIAVGYLAIGTGTQAKKLISLQGLSVGLAVILAVWGPTLRFVDVPDEGRIISYREGVMAAVSIVENREGVATLRINNRQQEGSTATRLVDARQALLPLLLHESPKHALFLGLGTGVTASSAAEEIYLKVDAVELLPEVIDASKYFTDFFSDNPNDPRLRVIAADARRYVRTTRQSYDVIVSDNFHPARSGSAALYTVEHFQSVRNRLSERGLFCQWLPLHQLDLMTVRSIVKSFNTIFSSGWAILASNSLETPVIGLIGSGDDNLFNLTSIRQRLSNHHFPVNLAEFGIDDEFSLMGSFIAGPAALASFAGNTIANTDDRPIVMYRAPRITYAPDSLPRDRLIALLKELTIEPLELMTDSADNQWSSRLAAYWSARNRYIEIGLNVQPNADVQIMLEQVLVPFLSLLRISPDFRPAYDPLIRMASALGKIDAGAAQKLLKDLSQLQPARSEADNLLRHIIEDQR